MPKEPVDHETDRLSMVRKENRQFKGVKNLFFQFSIKNDNAINAHKPIFPICMMGCC